MAKIYRNYDDDFIIESSHYDKHVSAMTGEQLHSKSDIAAELAFRDAEIERLRGRIGRAESTLLQAKRKMSERGVGVFIINRYFKGEPDDQ